MILLLILGAGLLYLLIYIVHKVWEAEKVLKSIEKSHYFDSMYGDHDE